MCSDNVLCLVLLILHDVCYFLIQSLSFIFLCSHLKQVSRLTAEHSVAQQDLSCQSITCRVSLSNHGRLSSSCFSLQLAGQYGSHSRAQHSSRCRVIEGSTVTSRSSSVEFKEEFMSAIRDLNETPYHDQSTPNMTGRTFHRTMEMIPRPPLVV